MSTPIRTDRDLPWTAIAALTDHWMHRINPEPVSPGLALIDTPDGYSIKAVELWRIDYRDVITTIPVEAVIGDATLDQVMGDVDAAKKAGRYAAYLLLSQAGAL